MESLADVIEIWLNDRHPLHEHLIEVLEVDSDGEGPEELAARLRAAAFTVRMLLVAWARFEDRAPRGDKEQLKDFRMDWGRETRKFLSAIET